MSDLIMERVTQSLHELRLPAASGTLERHLQSAKERDLSPLQFLDALLTDEVTARQEKGMQLRMRLARFPVLKTLDSFEFDAQPSLDRRVINELRTLAFVERAQNVVLLGPPGVGKTHLATGLGVQALQAGHRAYFISAQDLLDQIRLAQLNGIPGHKQKHLLSTSWDTWSSTRRRQHGCFSLFANVMNAAPRSSPAINRSPIGERSSPTSLSPEPCWIASFTIAMYSISRVIATGYDPKTPGKEPDATKAPSRSSLRTGKREIKNPTHLRTRRAPLPAARSQPRPRPCVVGGLPTYHSLPLDPS
jgi:IstB-like ATP binding protein